MKKTLIVALMCLNAALLVALIAGVGTEKAYGQVIGANYLVVTGNIYGENDAVYVLDLSSRRLVGWWWEKSKRPLRMQPVSRGLDLLAEFDRKAE